MARSVGSSRSGSRRTWCPAAFFIGTLVTLDFLKLGFVTSILAIVVGNLVGSFFVALLSTMGPKLGLAQMPAARLPFGKSIVLPGLLNWLSTIGWDGINSVFGAVALTILFPALPVLGCAARDRRGPGHARDLRLRSDPHLREMGRDRAGRDVRHPDHLDRRPGRHQLHRRFQRRRPDRRLHRDGRHRGQLRPRLGPVRLGLLALPAGPTPRPGRSSGTRWRAWDLRRPGSRSSVCWSRPRRPAANRARRSTTSSAAAARSWPAWRWWRSSSGRSPSTR